MSVLLSAYDLPKPLTHAEALRDLRGDLVEQVSELSALLASTPADAHALIARREGQWMEAVGWLRKLDQYLSRVRPRRRSTRRPAQEVLRG